MKGRKILTSSKKVYLHPRALYLKPKKCHRNRITEWKKNQQNNVNCQTQKQGFGGRKRMKERKPNPNFIVAMRRNRKHFKTTPKLRWKNQKRKKKGLFFHSFLFLFSKKVSSVSSSVTDSNFTSSLSSSCFCSVVFDCFIRLAAGAFTLGKNG